MAFLGFLILAGLGLLTLCGLGYIMATLAEVKADLDDLKAASEAEKVQSQAVLAELARLREILANGGSITPEDLDAVRAQVAEIKGIVVDIAPETP